MHADHSRRVVDDLIDGLPGGRYLPYWWRPDNDKTQKAAQMLGIAATLPELGPEVIPGIWANLLGYTLHPDDACAYGLLELTGMNAQQFCAFWWMLDHDPGYPLTESADDRLRRRITQFAYRLVINARFPESLDFGHSLLLYDQAYEMGLKPLDLQTWGVLPDYRGWPSRLW